MAFDFVSFPAVLISWTAYMTIASIWYAAFNKTCVALAHNNKQPPLDRKALWISALGSLVALTFFSFILSVAKCSSSIEGLLWGLSLGLFDAGIGVCHTFFEERPLELFAIHHGCHSVGLVTCGIILGALCTT